jgi:UDP-N-acetylmuramyl pentapeptide synthase
MFLTFHDLAKLFPNSKGVKDEFIFFTVATDARLSQERGLFIPLFSDSGELMTAIQNGAIACIWNERVPVPSYIPSQFPVLFTSDLRAAFDKILRSYSQNIDGEKNEMNDRTNFLINQEKLLNDNFSSYDKQLLTFVPKVERRG